MLIRLLRRYLQPYRRVLAGVVVLQLVGTMAALYLPSLNASIIDEGVAKGDTAFIWRTSTGCSASRPASSTGSGRRR